MPTKPIPNGDLLNMLARLEKQWGCRPSVSPELISFRPGQRSGRFLGTVGRRLFDAFPPIRSDNACFCAFTEGGKALAVMLAIQLNGSYVSPHTQIVRPTNASPATGFQLTWKSNRPLPGEQVWIVDDICLEFSRSQELIYLVEQAGAHVKGVICFLNATSSVQKILKGTRGKTYPIYAAVTKRISRRSLSRK